MVLAKPVGKLHVGVMEWLSSNGADQVWEKSEYGARTCLDSLGSLLFVV